MSRPSLSVSDLRQLLAARFPEKNRGETACVPTGIPPVDELLGGGLPLNQLTEWVVATPSSGGQLALTQLLASTRDQCCRIAWVDASDALDPSFIPEPHRLHLVWVRGNGLDSAIASAELLLRDGNFRVVIIDLRDVSAMSLRRWPATGWYRLQRGAETGRSAVLVVSETTTVPSASHRLEFNTPLDAPTALLRPRHDLCESLQPTATRSLHIARTG